MKTMKKEKNKVKGRVPKAKVKFPNSGENDKAWFNNIKGLLDSINMPQFLIRKGIPTLGSPSKIGIPTVAAIQVLPVIGANDQLAWSNAIDKLYANLRRANTGSATYTKQDLQKYIYNLSTAIIVDRYIRRAYGLCNMYSGVDASKPIAYFKAMGLDYASFKDNMSNLRTFINNNSIRLHSILAGKCDLFERRAWMFDNIFKDGQTNKAQEYMFTIPESLSYYDWSSDTITSVVIPLYASSTVGRTYTNVISAVNTFMHNITASNKVNYIAADIIKAYGLEQTKDYFMVIPEDYSVHPVYSEEVLNEIQNAKFAGGIAHNLSVDSDGNLVERPTNTFINGTFNTSIAAFVEYLSDNYINYYKDKIDILDYAVATRLSPRLEFKTESGSDFVEAVSYGTEIPQFINFVVNIDNAVLANMIGNGIDVNGMTLTKYDVFSVRLVAGTNINDYLRSLWSYFDWAPMLIILMYGYYDTAGVLTYHTDDAIPEFDFDNYAKLDTTVQLSNIHSACVLSVYYWPDVIRKQTVININ